MNDLHLDARLVAATPRRSDDTNNFVKKTMKHIKHTALSRQLPKPTKLGFFPQLLRYHKPAAIILAIVALTILSGAVYAAVHFAPAFVQLLGKETNQRGATEYSVSGFTACASDKPVPQKFEIKADTPNLNDEEIHKIIQARCELDWLEKFPQTIWPSTGPQGQWKEGDTIYYTRLDMLGTYKNGDQTNALVDTGDNPLTFTAPAGEHIRAFAAGQEIALTDIKPGDIVFTISRFSEVHHEFKMGLPKDQADAQNQFKIQSQPKTIGLVALFKLSLPYDYYTQKQQYVTEIPACIGNTDELCPQTGSIDVYPRIGGEGASNPYYNYNAAATYTHREISGTVTALSDDTLTLTSRSGKEYHVTVGDAGFKVYNRDFTAAYTDIDAHLKIGSNVSVLYAQPANANPTTIDKEQVERVALLLEAVNIKHGPIKQY